MILEFFFFFNLILTCHFMSSKYNSPANISSVFQILNGSWSAGCKYLTIHHLKHSLRFIFCILIKAFFVWFNSPSNLIKLLPAKGLYFEILIL